MAQSPYDQLGGEKRLRAIIDAFVDRLFDDIMIGFFFRNATRDRVKEFEFQHAAEFLGANITYEGRPLRAVHQKLHIMGGQFARRKQILKEVLAAHNVPEPIAQAWLEHTESLRSLITHDPGSECTP